MIEGALEGAIDRCLLALGVNAYSAGIGIDPYFLGGDKGSSKQK